MNSSQIQKMTFSDAVQDLENREIMPDRPPALQLTHAGLEAIGLGENQITDILNGNLERIILVAGTNGKGSVCSSLETLLSSAGERVGLYTSPHLVEYTERIRVGEKQISKELFAYSYGFISEKTKELKLSHFEILTLMAVWIFFSGQAGPIVDRAIFEVGLGGTWDATNAIPHSINIIASLGKDHTHILGHSLGEIAENKFGIIRPHSKVIHSRFPREITPLSDRVRLRTSSTWTESISFGYSAKIGRPHPDFFVKTPWGKTKINLPGFRGAQNSALAVTAFRELGYDPSPHLSSLQRVSWPGRMQFFKSTNSETPIFMSGDHNPQGIQSLLELLPYYQRNHLHILVGVGKNKDLSGILAPLFALENTSVYLTETPFQGLKIHEYGSWLESSPGYWAFPEQALSYILDRAHPEDMILVTGSLYLVGHLTQSLNQKNL